MEITEFDRDEILTGFLTDYLDGELDQAGRKSFRAYLDRNPREKDFAKKAVRGKRALEYLRKYLVSQPKWIP